MRVIRAICGAKSWLHLNPGNARHPCVFEHLGSHFPGGLDMRTMNPGVSIRVAREADAEAIALLANELGYPANGQMIRARLARLGSRSDQLVLVVQAANGQICGWLQAHSSEVLESGFRVEITGLVVASSMRRRGVGRRLVERAESWASEVGAEAVVVRSNVSREESHAFYPALGYARTKTQNVYRKVIS